MNLINIIKEKIYSYVEYVSTENRYKQIFDIESSRLRHDVLTNTDLGIEENIYCNGKKVIVSLTTFGKRLYDVYLTIESIMQQTQKANKIVLWLADEMKDAKIPITLQRQQERGLEIRYCKDIRSYKKLIPSLNFFPDDIIITIDDDVIYSIDTIESLINSYLQVPNAIHCHLGREIRIDSTYKEWKYIHDDNIASYRTMPIGCGGVLYPPHTLDSEVFNEHVFESICPSADDIWFKAMALKHGTKCKLTQQNIHEFAYIDNPFWQDKGLTRTNVNKNKNDEQVRRVFEKYNLYKIMIS